MRIFYRTIIVLVLAGAAAGCGGRRTEPAPTPASVPAADTAAPSLPVYDAQPRDTGYRPANARNFAAMVRKEFAYTATTRAAPRHILDSLKLLRDPQKFIEGITRYTRVQDSLARLALSRKYDISLDSLDRIIHTKEAP